MITEFGDVNFNIINIQFSGTNIIYLFSDTNQVYMMDIINAQKITPVQHTKLSADPLIYQNNIYIHKNNQIILITSI